ncbi:MAG: acyl carrier protein [Ramlibacter sp.]|nr:acyl carrier protein [Ramlibacter sp.]
MRTWLTGRGFDPDTQAGDFDLIENRVIDSLHFMEFVLLLEQLTGRQILADGLTLDPFRTFNGIREHFLAGTETGDVEEEVL